MNVNEMKEMLDRHDGYMRVTIGGVEYDGGAIRLDRNGRVSLDLNPKFTEENYAREEAIEEAVHHMQEAIEALKP